MGSNKDAADVIEAEIVVLRLSRKTPVSAFIAKRLPLIALSGIGENIRSAPWVSYHASSGCDWSPAVTLCSLDSFQSEYADIERARARYKLRFIKIARGLHSL